MSDPLTRLPPPVDVLVVAPFPSVRRGLAALLSEFPDLSPREAVGGAESTAPDVVVAYVANGLPGIDAGEAIETQTPAVYVVEGSIAELPELGDHPVALVQAESDGAALRAAVLAVFNGLSVVDTSFAVNAGIVWKQPLPASTESGDVLTAREVEVLNLVANGWPNKTIATALGISEHTVKFHVGSILSKLGAESRTEAVTIATRRGLVVI